MMKNWKKLTKRGLALFIALVMCMSAMSLTAFAEEAPADPAEAGEVQDGAEAEVKVESGSEEQEESEIEEETESVEEEESEAEEEIESKEEVEPKEEPRTEDESESTEEETGSAEESDDTAEDETAPAASLEDEEVVAFLAAVTALEELSESDDAEANLAAMQAVIDCYDDLSEEQKALLGDGCAEMVQTLKDGIALLNETEDEALEKPFKVGENTYATLQAALNAADSGDTIYITENVTMYEFAQVWRKSVTIDGQGHTLTRGEPFAARQDNARSTYNPAMIEVNGQLRLEDIILDDAKKTASTRYDQATTDGTGGNSDTVQDAIIACYDGDGDEITLGDGVELRNFGGMSAVRLSGGKLTMESGSKIVGSKNFSDKGNGIGAAAAIWIQGGELDMQVGSMIGGTDELQMYGRAIYVDGGKATVHGTIRGITTNKFMWNANRSTAVVETGIHIRNGADVTLSGTIDNEGYGGAVKLDNSTSSFTMVSGSKIQNTTSYAISASAGSVLIDEGALITDCKYGVFVGDGSHVTLNGTITKGTGEHPVLVNTPDGSDFSTLVVGATGKITNNYANYGAIYLQSGAVDLYGEISGNYTRQHGGGISTPGHGTAVIRMYEGAIISNNYDGEHGGGVQIKDNATFIMNGGTISNNIAVKDGGGVAVRGSGKFIMNGGIIENNSTALTGGGIAISNGTVEINGGTIRNNKMNVSVTPDLDTLSATAFGGIDNDLSNFGGNGPSSYSVVNSGTVSDRNVYMTTNKKTVTVTDGTKLGNASSADNTALTNASKGKGWDALKATLWLQNANVADVTVAGITFDEDLPVYVLVKDGSNIKSLRAELDDSVASFAVPGSENGTSIALAQPGKDYGTLTLAAVPALLKDNDEAKVTYTLTYAPSALIGSSIEDIADAIALDVDGQMVTKEELQKGFSTTWEETVTFAAGQSIEKSATLTFTLGGTLVEVPSNLAVTRMENRKEVTITFDSNGGTTVASQTVKEGDRATKPEDPTKNGYTFQNWTLNGGVYGFDTPVTADITLTALWGDHRHDFGTNELVVVTAPTCLASGTGTRRCNICNEDVSETIPATGSHTFSEAWTTDENNHWHTCTVCGTADRPEAHTFGEWVETTPATTTARGEETRTCSVCRAAQTRETAMLDPAPVTPVTPVIPVTPNNPTPTPGVTISDENPPLANVTGLNNTEHFAYVIGDPTGTVRPLDNITRAEVATIFFRLMNEEYRVANWSVTNSFTDTNPGDWYNAAISTAARAGLVQGYPDGSVQPNAPITHAEFVTLAARFASDELNDEGVGDFNDTEGFWAAKEIRMAAKAGWITWVEDGYFRPDEYITRAEVMAMINRMLDRVPDTEHMLEDMKTWSDNPVGTSYYADVQEATNGHQYEYAEDGVTEIWTGLDEEKDWDALLAEWTANNGASAPKADGEDEAA